MNKVVALERTHRIRVLNDNFRSTFIGGRVVMSAGVAALSLSVKSHVFVHIHKFADFSPDNDLHAEHDFGSFEVAGEKFFWKIDYYDVDMINGSEDPDWRAFDES